MAVKWLGNIGSHANDDNFCKDHLLDGFEVLEHAINMIYDASPERIKKLAAKMAARKGRP